MDDGNTKPTKSPDSPVHVGVSDISENNLAAVFTRMLLLDDTYRDGCHVPGLAHDMAVTLHDHVYVNIILQPTAVHEIVQTVLNANRANTVHFRIISKIIGATVQMLTALATVVS